MKNKLQKILRWGEKYTKTDMVYLARGSFWMNSNMIIATLLSFLLSISFANLMSKEQFGMYQFFLSITAILTTFTLTGMNVSIGRSVARGFEGSFIQSIKVQLRYGMICFLLSTIISTYYFINHNLPIAVTILIIGFLIPIQNSFNTYVSFIGGKKDFRKMFWFAQAINIPYIFVMILSLFITNNPFIIICINVGFNTLANIILHFVFLHIYKPNNNIDPSDIHYGKYLSWVGIIGSIAGQLDKLIIFHYVGAAELAIYAFATTLPEKINIMPKTISNLASPKFATQTMENIRNNILSKVIRIAALTLVISLIYVLFAPFIYKYLFPNYTGSILYSQIYSIMLVFSSLLTLPLSALTALQAKKEILFFNIVSPIVNISTVILMAYIYGIWGLILAKGISGLILFGILIFSIYYKKLK